MTSEYSVASIGLGLVFRLVYSAGLGHSSENGLPTLMTLSTLLVRAVD